MDSPLLMTVALVIIAIVGFIIFAKITKALMKIGFILVGIVVLLVLFWDKLPLG